MGIRWRARAGCRWRDVPERYGPWASVYGLFRPWQRDGSWAAILTRLQARADAAGLITWEVSVDSTVVRAHQHAAGARGKGDLSCEQRQKPLSIVITAGQRGNSPQFQAMVHGIRVPRLGRGRPRTRPDRVLGDTAYGSRGQPGLPAAARHHLHHPGKGRSDPQPQETGTAPVAARPRSIPNATGPATPWNAASTGSNATGP